MTPMNSYLMDDELMDVLYAVRVKDTGTVCLTFINGAGEKADLVISSDAASDLCNELNDLGFGV
ncbi:MAG: hypothetical protein O3C28_14755 [Proteobacteria bacterium]|nr:hypothetical protein [Pseudomonadota bacterium]